jgi:TonB family protein
VWRKGRGTSDTLGLTYSNGTLRRNWGAFFMATRMGFRVSLFCVFASELCLAAQQTADHHAEAKGGVARAAANGVGTPQCIRCPPPSYSKKARAAKYQGTVVLDVTVTADGKIIDPKAIKDPGLGLTEKALTQVKKWKMKPALGRDGKPVDCRVQIEVTFHLY